MGFLVICIILSVLISFLLWFVVGCLWGSFRDFFHNNYSFFDASFILSYFIEQLTLIILFFKFSQYSSFLVGAFALIVMTTVSFQKLTMESRNRKISETAMNLRGVISSGQERERKLRNQNRLLEQKIKNTTNLVKELLGELRGILQKE